MLLFQVLVERLLSTCPEVAQLHLLMRPKKGLLPDKRLLQLKQSQVFDILRQKDPQQLNKLSIIPGDVTQPNLGISEEYLKKLDKVSIVFHSAATVKFDELLGCAVEQNIRSVIRVMDICDSLPNIETLIHVSTAYSNAEHPRVEERVYKSPEELSKLLTLVDVLPTDLLQKITPEYIAPKANTYIFTKAMAESVVFSRSSKKYSIAIFRPTTVVASLSHPFPGWVENLNGPPGVIATAGKGILHVFRIDKTKVADLLPVDIAVNTLIAVAWETTVDKLDTIRVYNSSTCENPITWNMFELYMRKYLRGESPLDNAIWYPSGFSLENKYTHMFFEFLLNSLPLYILEFILRGLRIDIKINLIRVAQKTKAMSSLLAYFTMREWFFYTENVKRLMNRLTPEDRAIYNLDPTTIDWENLMENFLLGTRRYILKEKDENLPKARKHMRRLRYVHKTVMLFAILLFIRFLLQNRFVRYYVSNGLKYLMSYVLA
ncbi:unnamed protein product [Leptidea sinapis]|uniref:Fatty acyl-CoA reductase n=1 Tax=Leptidea sinapis TaxID=189913 RepID=A0A5E4QZB9_9NEOP|nr:unnamed protein product [Leptidea sinapis]